MNFSKLASLPQVNNPSAPPVEMMYFILALTKSCTLLATCVGVRPAQLSLPHSPLANAQVSVEFAAVMTCVTGSRVPVTAVLITLVFQFMLTVMSL